MLPDIQPGNTKILYFFNCLLDGMHTIGSLWERLLACGRPEFAIVYIEISGLQANIFTKVKIKSKLCLKIHQNIWIN